MGKIANWTVRVIENGGESYLLLPRLIARGYDVIRLKDYQPVGAFWLKQSRCGDLVQHQIGSDALSATAIGQIALAGINAGLAGQHGWKRGDGG
jgi:hypothetical protein